MDKLREAARQVVDAWDLGEFSTRMDESITALREALAEQAEQEPVADYAYQSIEEYEDLCGMQVNDAFKIGWDMARTTNAMLGIKAAPVRTKDLTDDEISRLWYDSSYGDSGIDFARAVIAADREKNK